MAIFNTIFTDEHFAASYVTNYYFQQSCKNGAEYHNRSKCMGTSNTDSLQIIFSDLTMTNITSVADTYEVFSSTPLQL